MRKWGTQEILGALTSLDETALPDDFIDVRTAEHRPQHS